MLFKCKACGGNIIPNENGFTGKCEYCGTIQTLPKDKDERISQILNRANDYRLNSEFDRAIFEYEKVLELDETEPEAHWGLFLSKYGVEYVRDTMSLTYKPTLHRISSISVYDDVDYQATLKYASFVASEQYKADAMLIEAVMKEFLLLSYNQEPYDIFLSYKELDDVTRQRTNDSYLAHDLYNELSTQGYKVFFAPKSLGVGLYEPKIYSAIISSKVMIVLGTKPEYLEGVWVKNEWSRFAELVEKGEDKVIIPVFKNMEAGQLPNRIAKYQAYDMASMTFLPTIFDVISKVVKKESKIDFNKNASAEAAFIERGFIALEDREFSKADSFFENALNLNPYSSQAYFGKLMVEMNVSKKEQILTASQPLKMYKNFEKAVRFADQQQKTVLLQYEEKVKYTLDEQEYNKAMAIINGEYPSESDYAKAAEIFKLIISFNDAKEKEALCLKKIDGFKKDEILQNAIEQENNVLGDEIENYRNAIEIYKTIPGWEDADERLARCEEKLEKILLAKEKAKRKKEMYLSIFYACIIIFLIAIPIVLTLLPKLTFDKEDKIFIKSDGTIIATGKYTSDTVDKNDVTAGEYSSVITQDVTGWTDIIAVSVGGNHTVGLKSNGTVVAVGDNSNGQCDVENWKDIVAISAVGNHTVGLKSNGTVVAVGDNYYGECEVSDWTDIVAISAVGGHTVGLKSNGTVVAVGDNSNGQCDVENWKGIIAVSAVRNHTVGLKSNGTVVAVGDNYYGECEVSDWTDIVAIYAVGDHTVGLKSNGTVVAVGDNDYGKCEVSDWTDIVAISTAWNYTVGLKSNGMVVAVGDNDKGQCNVSEWTDIVAISTGDYCTVGLKSDGTIVYVGNKTEYACSDYEDEDIVSIWID